MTRWWGHAPLAKRPRVSIILLAYNSAIWYPPVCVVGIITLLTYSRADCHRMSGQCDYIDPLVPTMEISLFIYLFNFTKTLLQIHY